MHKQIVVKCLLAVYCSSCFLFIPPSPYAMVYTVLSPSTGTDRVLRPMILTKQLDLPSSMTDAYTPSSTPRTNLAKELEKYSRPQSEHTVSYFCHANYLTQINQKVYQCFFLQYTHQCVKQSPSSCPCPTGPAWSQLDASFLSPHVLMHGGLLCVAFRLSVHLSVCLSVCDQKIIHWTKNH